MRFEIVQGDELLSSHSGLALVGGMLSSSKLRKRLDRVVLTDHPFPKISHGEVATAIIGLMCLGKPDFDAHGVSVTDDGTTITAEGFAPVTSGCRINFFSMRNKGFHRRERGARREGNGILNASSQRSLRPLR
jgi:hypothetical protein